MFPGPTGTNAVESALKLARKAQALRNGGDRSSFVALQDGFHGRTLGSLSVTSNAAYRTPFAPLSASHPRSPLQGRFWGLGPRSKLHDPTCTRRPDGATCGSPSGMHREGQAPLLPVRDARE